MSHTAPVSGSKSKVTRSFKRFLANEKGTMLQLFAASAMPFFLAAGLAVDMSRINREQSSFFSAMDAAALAIASDERSAIDSLPTAQQATRLAELEELAKKYVRANYRDASGGTAQFDIDLKVTGQKIEIDGTLEFPMTIMKLAGYNTYTLREHTEVMKAMRPIELVMVMDTTGSMNDPMSGYTKMYWAKKAGNTLLDTLYSGTQTNVPRSEFIRVGLVPFSAAVRLNQSAHDFDMDWIDTAGDNPLSRINFDASGAPATWNNFSAWNQLKVNSTTRLQWNGCVETRARGSAGALTDYNVNDVAPDSIDGNTLFPAYFAPDMRNGAYNDYISGTSLTSVGSECRGLTSTQCSSTSNANQFLKQENYRKYIDKVTGAESPSNDGPWNNCTATPVVPMTYDRASVASGLNSMSPNGNTNIPEGLAWGWRVISPGAPFTQVGASGSIPSAPIAPYNGPKWQKFIVLMSDGDNVAGSDALNLTTYGSNGFGVETTATNRFGTTTGPFNSVLDNNMAAVCSKIKATGVKIYVTSFGDGISSASRTRLQNCASTGPGYYTHASGPSELTAFFDHIGKDVVSKSIYVAK
jgi:hypothetical protein